MLYIGIISAVSAVPAGGRRSPRLRRGCEVVQLYIRDDYCRITPFVRQLRGFKKLWLQPGEEQTITFTLGFEDFAFINEKMEREVEPGSFTITIGTQQIKITI